eukprot:6460352-Amphidinium_carterae.2
MELINSKLSDEGMNWALPLPPSRLLQSTEEDPSCSIGSVAYRDDLALPIVADSNEDLIQLIRRTVRILEAAHREFHLRLNYSRGKSECTVHLQSPSSKGYMQGLKMLGKAAGLSGPAIPILLGGHILLAREYIHLGRSHAQSGSLRKEVTCRVAKATSAFKQYSKVLTSPSVAVRARIELFMTYVACHLLQHASVTPKLGDTEYHKLRSCYMVLLRKTLREASNAFKVSLLSDGDVCTNFNVPTFLSLWDRRRLKFLPKLLTLDNAPMRALLAAHMGSGSVWSGFFDTLARLHANHADLKDLPPPSEASFAVWCEYVISRHTEWLCIVKGHKVLDPPKKGSVRAEQPTGSADLTMDVDDVDPNEIVVGRATDVLASSVGTPEPSQSALGASSAGVCQFPCTLCDFQSKSAAGLAMHARRKHGLQTPLSLRLRTAKCPACLMWCENRHRALDHLKISKRCGRYVMENVTPMPEDEFKAVLDRERGVNHLWSRQMTPKAGPKPPGYRPALNVVAPMFASQDHAAAATSLG